MGYRVTGHFSRPSYEGIAGEASRADLQVMLRRAALLIRNAAPIGLEAETEDALLFIAGELGMTRNDMIRHIVKEWLETNAYLPVRELDEDGEVGGPAESYLPRTLLSSRDMAFDFRRHCGISCGAISSLSNKPRIHAPDIYIFIVGEK